MCPSQFVDASCSNATEEGVGPLQSEVITLEELRQQTETPALAEEGTSESQECGRPFGYQPLGEAGNNGGVSDDDEFGDYGYAPLSDEPDAQENEDQAATTVAPLVVPPPSEPIPEADAQLIREVMARFQFPEEAVPAWAKSIPESAWLPTVGERTIVTAVESNTPAVGTVLATGSERDKI
ncbi:hypothetical protein THASP1DRAFT_29914 [Thamnocephalis sphaerospora]|uniref:Uncharacterized protein n=1 Tax=Thamnocephalis sphaerospora TaxID=78915 RepID=A0A4P9XRY7_9FUNG|nr:hypothetical protein THASP1DRAFT_29914 [Thamnocephalis sphaerospora]|eukprot:RKP08281.1 hypothetical protein THASP1DRAFT_29914 [Thamnocephalis sphaerospora]